MLDLLKGCEVKLNVHKRNTRIEDNKAAIVQWILLRLPTFGPRFDSHVQNLRLL